MLHLSIVVVKHVTKTAAESAPGHLQKHAEKKKTQQQQLSAQMWDIGIVWHGEKDSHHLASMWGCDDTPSRIYICGCATIYLDYLKSLILYPFLAS